MERLNLTCDSGSLRIYEMGIRDMPEQVEYVEIQVQDFGLPTDTGLSLTVTVDREDEGEMSGEIVAHLTTPQIIYLRNYLSAYLQINGEEKGPTSEEAKPSSV